MDKICGGAILATRSVDFTGGAVAVQEKHAGAAVGLTALYWLNPGITITLQRRPPRCLLAIVPPARMPYRLLRFALSKKYPEPRMFREPARLKDSYEVVIIGGGGHGLGAAYYLAKDYGITDIAVIEKGYIGGGNTGRNTAIVRSNYLTVE